MEKKLFLQDNLNIHVYKFVKIWCFAYFQNIFNFTKCKYLKKLILFNNNIIFVYILNILLKYIFLYYKQLYNSRMNT